MDGLHLRRVHRDARLGDDMAEVGDGRDAEGALGALDEELVLAQHGEDGSEMAEVVGPCLAVNVILNGSKRPFRPV